MKYVLSSERVRETERYTINEIGIDESVLMERAAMQVAFSVTERYKCDKTRILVVCGSGNNGADGLCVARILKEYGYYVRVYSKDSKTELHLKNRLILSKLYSDDIFTDLNRIFDDSYDLIIDALYGIGINRDFSEADVKLISDINAYGSKIISIDIPSGLNSTSGDVYNACIKADETVCVGAYKKGLFIGKGPDYSGQVFFGRIGFSVLYNREDYISLDKEDIKSIEINRLNTANKGTYGKTLLIAGSESIYGAGFLASKTAIMSGAGMIKIITHNNNRYSLQHDIPEAMFSFYDETIDLNSLNDNIAWSDSIVIGPGLSQCDTACELVKGLLESPNLSGKILIVDADAINIISNDIKLFDLLAEKSLKGIVKCVITPHKKELSRLMKLLDNDKPEEEFCVGLYDNYRIVTVNKDANTRIFGANTFINLTGNEGMATAGSGDVLSGLLGGLLYRIKNVDFTSAVAVCVWLHGKAGDLYTESNNSVSLTAVELMSHVGKALDFLT